MAGEQGAFVWCELMTTDVAAAKAAAAKVQHLGGHLLGPPIDIPTVGRFATVMDPQGALFNLFKPAMVGQRIVSPEPGNVGWHELHNDRPQAFDFYADMSAARSRRVRIKCRAATGFCRRQTRKVRYSRGRARENRIGRRGTGAKRGQVR